MSGDPLWKFQPYCRDLHCLLGFLSLMSTDCVGRRRPIGVSRNVPGSLSDPGGISDGN